jgi:S1-C subfamily serine protease
MRLMLRFLSQRGVEHRLCLRAAILIFIFCAPLAATAAEKLTLKTPNAHAPPARPLKLAGEVNDDQMDIYLDEQADRLLKSGRTVKMSDLTRQLQRRSTTVQLPRPPTAKLSTVELNERARAGLMVIGNLYKCKLCPRWHVGVSSGFVLTADGVCATCYHVVNVQSSPTLIAMTGDRQVVPVREILACNPNTDTALLRIDGSGYTPLPLGSEAPVGAPVRVLSHPDDHFFTLTEGIISRYVTLPVERGAGELTMMSITADFGAGSSGAPVFDERGGVVAMVANTQSLYWDQKRSRDLQMVFKQCLPSQYIRELIRDAR